MDMLKFKNPMVNIKQTLKGNDITKSPNTVAKNFLFQFKSIMPSLFWPGQLTELSLAWAA